MNIAAQFLRLFFNKDNWTRASLVDSFQKDYQILDLLIQELGYYLGQVREQVELLAKSEEEANKTLNKEQLGERVFFSIFPHKI